MSDSLVIRRLPPGVKQGLRERAGKHGRSVEAEVRQVLSDLVFPPKDFVREWLADIDKLPAGPDLEVPTRRSGREPAGFE